MKGETSGNRLRIVSASTDCDNDTLLFRVAVEGDGLVCHEGTVSCFTRPIATSRQPRRSPVANKLRLGLPKGSLQDATLALFAAPDGTSTPTAVPTFPPSTTAKSSAC